MPKALPVLILAGGLGTRINNLYPALPKAMIPINGEPFIAHQLRLLARENITDVILCLGHLSDSIASLVGKGDAFGLNVTYSYDGENLCGTGGAVYKASLNLKQPFAVIYGDSYLDTNYSQIFHSFNQSHKLGLLTVFKNENNWIPSNLSCHSGLVIDYNKAAPKKDMHYVDYGLSIFEPKVFSRYSANQIFDLSEVFMSLIGQQQLAAYEVKERFYEAGSPQGIEELSSYLKQHKPK